MTTSPRKVLIPALLLGVGVAVASAAGAVDKEPKDAKAGRDTPAVMKDIKEGKAKKIKTGKRTTGVWDGCEFHYLKTDESVYRFDDDSVATVSENPEPLPPKDPSCTTSRNPTRAEMDEMEARVAKANPYTPPPGAPPVPPLPPDRYRGTP